MTTMRIGGLASGMDIDSIVEQLMVVERTPLDKLEQQKQKYEWQRDAYRDVNTKLQALDTYIADNLLLKTFNTKTASTSNSTYVTVAATGSATGSLTIEGVSQLATAARGVGEQVNATGSMTLEALFKNEGITFPTTNQYIELSAIQKGGTLAEEPTRIDFSKDMTIDQFISKLNGSNAGVNAVFENGRLSITAANTGDVKGDSEIVVDYGGDVFKAFGFADPANLVTEKGANAIFRVNGIATERSTNTFTISGYSVTLKDTFNSDSTINKMLEASFITWKNAREDLPAKLDTLSQKKTAYQDALNEFKVVFDESFLQKELTTDLQTTYKSIENTEILTKLTYEQFTALKNHTIDYTNESTISASINNLSNELFTTDQKEALKEYTANELQSVQVLTASETDYSELKRVAKLEATYDPIDKTALSSLTASEIEKLSSLDLSGDKPLEAITDPTLKQKLSKLTVAQLQSLDTLSQDQLTAFNTLAKKEVELELSKLEEEKEQAQADVDATKARRDDAKYTVGKLMIENGLLPPDATQQDIDNALVDHYNNNTIPQLTSPATDTVSSVSLTSTSDVDDMVGKIKEFVTTYNGLIKELNNITKEEIYRDYKPLTSIQKEGMEDKQIELWEERAKSGLLRGDSIIESGLSSMRNLIYQTNHEVANPKYQTLFSIGITTSKAYFEGGTLEIDEDKLRKALEEDPNAVTTLFRNYDGAKEDTISINGVKTEKVDTRGYLQKLRDAMDGIKSKIEERAGRTSWTQSQYTIGKNLKQVDDSIATWKDKLLDMEDRYWRQFTAMESAISKANQQSAMLMGNYF